MDQVICYAGTRYPERPLRFTCEGRWLAVDEVLSEMRSLEGVAFHVRAEDGLRYRLAWREQSDEWTCYREDVRPGLGRS